MTTPLLLIVLLDFVLEGLFLVLVLVGHGLWIRVNAVGVTSIRDRWQFSSSSLIVLVVGVLVDNTGRTTHMQLSPTWFPCSRAMFRPQLTR